MRVRGKIARSHPRDLKSQVCQSGFYTVGNRKLAQDLLKGIFASTISLKCV